MQKSKSAMLKYRYIYKKENAIFIQIKFHHTKGIKILSRRRKKVHFS